MAHFAEIDDNNTVLRVIVISNDDAPGEFPDSEPIGQQFIANIGLNGTWLQCSYNHNFRDHYPGPGWTYNPTTDKFEAPE